MFENRAVRYIIYGTSAVVLSEVFYYFYRCVRDAVRNRVDNAEIAEVIWTNELTQTCTQQHRTPSAADGNDDQANANTHSAAKSAELNGRIFKLPSPSKSNVCSNRFCAANNMGRLIALIDEAQYSIDLAMYTFTSFEIAQAFSRALRRGVSIRIVSDKEMVYSTGSQIITLTKAGIPVRSPSTTMLMHHKFCILDGPMRSNLLLSKVGKSYDKKRVKGILMSGSLNWTMQGFGGNWENILITSNKILVKKFEDEYQRMWKSFEHKIGPRI